uniref:Uncharacterized protein n=1 Tax=Alexandrium catenella TaxID=2925 RepID=A0A7S1PR27_ALECA
MGKRKTGPLREPEEEAVEPKESKKKSRFTHVSELSYESLQSRATELESDVQQVRRGLERLKGNNTTLYGNTEAKILNNRLRRAETAYGEVQRELVKRLQEMQRDPARLAQHPLGSSLRHVAQLMRFGLGPDALPVAPAASSALPSLPLGPAVPQPAAPLLSVPGLMGALGAGPMPAAFRHLGAVPPAPPHGVLTVGGLAQSPHVGAIGGGLLAAPQMLPHFG